MGCDGLKRRSPPPKFDFNPRTRMGCDAFIHNQKAATGNFNPRTRMGCDSSTFNDLEYFTISIHAPAWGATDIEAD